MCPFISNGFVIDNIVGSWYFIYSHNLCLLIGAFRQLIFKVIIDIVGLISTIFVTVFYLLPLFLLFLSSNLFLPFESINEKLTWLYFLSFLSLSVILLILLLLVVALECAAYIYNWSSSLSNNTIPHHRQCEYLIITK